MYVSVIVYAVFIVPAGRLPSPPFIKRNKGQTRMLSTIDKAILSSGFEETVPLSGM